MSRDRHRLLRRQLRDATRRAVRLARTRQRELAGVLVLHGGVLGLTELTNVSRRQGSFQLRSKDVRAAATAARRLGSRVVGTFHSHVAWLAKPGKTDIAGARDGSLMLIIDTISREARLWRIRGHRAYKLAFEEV